MMFLNCALLLTAVFITTAKAAQLFRTYTFTQAQKSIIVQAHNRLRKLEPAANMQEMVWDDNLARLAAGHAATCNAWHRPAHQRRGFGYKYIGENIWWSTETWLRSNLDAIVQDLYNEKPYYNFNARYCQPGQQCGHYTQVVWHSSCAVGCAASYCNGIINGRGITHGHIYVCNYGPGGNAHGQYPYTVGQSCSKCPTGQCYNGLCAPQCAGTSFFTLTKPIPQNPKIEPKQPPPPPPPPPKPLKLSKSVNDGTCVDSDNQCPFWAKIGECNRNVPYMYLFCKRSCSQCAMAGGSQPAPVTPTIDCTDGHYLCPFWGRTGECTANPSWMLRNCIASCNPNACANKPTKFSVSPVSDCRDNESQCRFWSGIGECDRNPEYMLWKCRASCGKC